MTHTGPEKRDVTAALEQGADRRHQDTVITAPQRVRASASCRGGNMTTELILVLLLRGRLRSSPARVPRGAGKETVLNISYKLRVLFQRSWVSSDLRPLVRIFSIKDAEETSVHIRPHSYNCLSASGGSGV